MAKTPKYPVKGPINGHKGLAQGDALDVARSESRVGGSKKDLSGKSNK